MSQNTYNIEQIEEISSAILNAFKEDNKSVVDVINIANRLGFDVSQAKFDGDISGMVKNSKDSKQIFVNNQDIPTRQRFTIAHEIGHIILHHDSLDKDFNVIDYRNNGTFSRKESEADSFAASLLMPKVRAIRVWNFYEDVDDFADEFKVSKMAASIRLRNLGLI